MAKKKKSKSVNKASKSRTGKKKATSSGSGGRSSAASKKPTKKKKTTKKTTRSTAAATTTKSAAKTSAPGKKKVTAAKASSPSVPKSEPSNPAVVPIKTGSIKPSSLNGPPPKPRNGEAVEWTPAKLRKVKTGLTRKDFNYFLALLLEKRAEIVGDVAGLEAARRAQDGDISHVPLHMADVGSDNYEQEFTLGLMESERKLVHDIDDAIARIQDKTYGVCIESGEPIPRARLEIKPWARYTIEVVRERERHGLPV